MFMVNLDELVKVRPIGFVANIIIGKQVNEKCHRGKGKVTFPSLLNNCHAGDCQVRWCVGYNVRHKASDFGVVVCSVINDWSGGWENWGRGSKGI